MKNLRMYEDFDLDKFMEDPSGNIQDDDNPEIEPGDWTYSYRGIGQVLELPKGDNGLATVQLANSFKSIVKVPFEKLSKIKKGEAESVIKNIPLTSKEIVEMGDEIEEYLEEIGAYEHDDVYLEDVNPSIEFLEDLLIQSIDLKKRDPYMIYHKEYSNIIIGFGTIADAIKNSTEDKSILNRLDKIEDDFMGLN